MKKRIYHLVFDDTDTEHLVRASHPNSALMHVVRNMAAVKVADQDTLVRLLAAGVKVEEAAPDADEPPAGAASAPLWPDPAAAAAVVPPNPPEPAPPPLAAANRAPTKRAGRTAAAPAPQPAPEV